MNNLDQPQITKTIKGQKGNILFAISLSIFLYGAYFYNLVRQHLLTFTQKQTALESIKAIAVPGTSFLNSLDNFFTLKSSFFYLSLIGMMLLVFMLIPLFFRSHFLRGIFLLTGLLALIILTLNDRVNISFPFVISLSFASFYLLTLSYRLVFSLKEGLILFLLMILISVSLFYGSGNYFFGKTRDKVFFDTTLGNKIISFYYT